MLPMHIKLRLIYTYTSIQELERIPVVNLLSSIGLLELFSVKRQRKKKKLLICSSFLSDDLTDVLLKKIHTQNSLFRW